ncbi:CAAX amino terminal protease [Novosphingobium barchaimii LL02]|uniref:CAAX amino terminal protease n=1 Tax=Novosphingobium barchaimii LL02 TaxID=1114963 RepID=A0A0J7XUK4_9SPHN|nr:CPBP family glutamic-type intramembrane protease [Novosphingobium barchaimii]KMS55312.1 CAAX amino terminal protease [Novosphingobium barchaimii LL02]
MATQIETRIPGPQILRELAGFLKRPAVLVPWGLRRGEAWRALGVLAAVHVGGLLLVLLPLLGMWQKAFDLPLPDAFGKLPGGWLLPITILIAPLLEEIIFRGWHTGRPRALWLLGCFALFVVLTMTAQAIAPLVLAGLLLATVLAAAGGWWWLRRRGPSAAFAAAYPGVFWAVAALFAGVHLMNYPSASIASLPMVLPQFWAALLLGFTRQRIGLPAAILQHAIANASSMALVMAGS